MQSKTIVLVIAALVIGLVAGFALRPAIAPTGSAVTAGSSPSLPVAAPRAKQYFDAHLEEGRAVVAGCAAGSVRGDECANAQNAVIEADNRARTRKFLGARP